ncbi:hypothetical protein F5884DRAFT_811725, partial [Xylogone sp. PMI_703]
MLRLPDEILLEILKYLHYVDTDFSVHGKKDDLLSSRATCKRLAIVGQGLAFEHVTFTQRKGSYAALLKMSKFPCACKAIRRLTCSFEAFQTKPEHSQGAYSRQKTWIQREFDRLSDIYYHGCQHQQFEDSNVDTASLASALSCFQKLSSVRIVEDLSTLWGDWFPDDPSYTENGARLFETITTALFVSGLEIDELHLESASTGSPAFTGIIQNLSSAALMPYPYVFGKLRRLRMLLPWRVDGEQLNFDSISKLIQSAASSLEELVLQSDQYSYPLPRDFL